MGIMLAGALLWTAVRYYESRDVMRFGDMAVVLRNAAPGDMVEMAIPVRKLRRCTIQPDHSDVVVVDRAEEIHLVRNFAGFRRALPLGDFEIPLRAEVSELARPGPGRIQLIMTWSCRTTIVRQASPEYPFTIIEESVDAHT